MGGETGRFLFMVYMRTFSTRDDFTRDLICKVSIVLVKLDGVSAYVKKIVPLQPGCRFARDGTKNVAAKLFPYKRNGTSKR